MPAINPEASAVILTLIDVSAMIDLRQRKHIKERRDGLLEYRVRNPAVARAVDPVQRRRAGSADRDDGAAAGRARHRHGRRRGPPARARTRPRRLAVEPDETARKVGDHLPRIGLVQGAPRSLVAKIRGDKDVSWRLVTPFGVKRLEPREGQVIFPPLPARAF